MLDLTWLYTEATGGNTLGIFLLLKPASQVAAILNSNCTNIGIF